MWSPYSWRCITTSLSPGSSFTSSTVCRYVTHHILITLTTIPSVISTTTYWNSPGIVPDPTINILLYSTRSYLYTIFVTRVFFYLFNVTRPCLVFVVRSVSLSLSFIIFPLSNSGPGRIATGRRLRQTNNTERLPFRIELRSFNGIRSSGILIM